MLIIHVVALVIHEVSLDHSSNMKDHLTPSDERGWSYSSANDIKEPVLGSV